MKRRRFCSDSSGVRIRIFQVRDYDKVVALWRRSEGVGLNESDTRVAIAAYLRRNPRLSFVAERNNRIIGAVLCGHDGRRGYLHHLAVAKSHRNKGVGGQLVNACLAKLRAADIHKCNIFVLGGNKEGMKFWKHNGWTARTDLCVMQISLSDLSTAKGGCSC